MNRKSMFGLLFVLASFGHRFLVAGEGLPAGVKCLLEDNAAELLPQLTNPGGDIGEGEVEKEVVFSGRTALKITNYQRYFNLLQGWAFRIRENPVEGQYRYLRFAWKADGASGIMLQLHDDKDWNIRYTAGTNKFGWTTQTVAPSPPIDWTVVTVDLFKDFGEREIHGIAFTSFDGTAGYFDHVYLARTVAELDAIDATGLGDGAAVVLTSDQLEKYWAQLSNADASVRYRAFWALATAGESARTFMTSKLGKQAGETDASKIAEWLQHLDHDEYAIRERATANLTTHLHQARSQMESELERTTSVETRARLTQVLKKADQPLDEAAILQQRARRILRIIAERDD